MKVDKYKAGQRLQLYIFTLPTKFHQEQQGTVTLDTNSLTLQWDKS